MVARRVVLLLPAREPLRRCDITDRLGAEEEEEEGGGGGEEEGEEKRKGGGRWGGGFK
jgi:hypothetical protein